MCRCGDEIGGSGCVSTTAWENVDGAEEGE